MQAHHLPLALRELQNGLEYQLHGPVSSWVLVKGFRGLGFGFKVP